MLQGQIQQAMETYQMALVLNPQLVDAHTNLGNHCMHPPVLSLH